MEQTEPAAIADELHRTLRRLTAATIVLYVGLAVSLAVAVVLSSRDRGELHRQEAKTRLEEVKTTGALCTLRHDLEKRAESSEQFLRDHPHGIPGIPAGVLRTSIANQRSTIRALATLRCPPV